MTLGKRTAQLLREAIVLAHVEGARWAGYTSGDGYPKDSEVVSRVLGAAANMRDLYPRLGRLGEATEADARQREASMERIASLFASLQDSDHGRDMTHYSGDGCDTHD